jgi:hypothetical protein
MKTIMLVSVLLSTVTLVETAHAGDNKCWIHISSEPGPYSDYGTISDNVYVSTDIPTCQSDWNVDIVNFCQNMIPFQMGNFSGFAYQETDNVYMPVSGYCFEGNPYF